MPESPEITEALGHLLLPPLWNMVSGYFSAVERWYLAGIQVFQLKRDPVHNTAVYAGVLDVFLTEIVRENYLHMLEPLCRHAVQACGEWSCRGGGIQDMILLGRIEMLEFLHFYQPNDLSEYYRDVIGGGGYCYASAKIGFLEVLMWEQHHGYKCWNESTAYVLARHGHMSVLQELRRGETKCPWDYETFEAAIHSDNVDLVDWLRTQDIDISEAVPEDYVVSIKMVRYFVENKVSNFSTGGVLMNALQSGDLEMVKCLVEQTDALNVMGEFDAVLAAGQSFDGDPSMLEYLLDRGLACSEEQLSQMHPEIRAWYATGSRWRSTA